MRDHNIARIAWSGGTSYAAPGRGVLEILSGTPLDGMAPTGRHVPFEDVRFLPPVPATKLIGIGANFPGDGERSPDPVPSFFIKPPSAFAGHLSTVELPPVFRSVVAEGELGVVIKRRCRHLRPSDVPGIILGWTIVNDLSGRDSILRTVPPAVKKSADGFAPMGPYLNLDSRIRPFELKTLRNGALVQTGSTASLRFNVIDCLVYVTSILTLEPYDVVALGTPPPKPPLKAGDEVAVEISELGCLVNRLTGCAELVFSSEASTREALS